MKQSYLLILPLLFASCATVLNRTYTTTRVTTYPAGAKIIINQKDTICCSDNWVTVPRSGQPLSLEIVKDTLNQKITVYPKTSATYYWNFYSPYCLGYVADLFSEKRFTYPSNVFVDLYNPQNSYQPYKDWKRNDDKPINIGLSIPLFNNYYYSGNGKNNSMSGTLGLGLHGEYYLNEKYYLSAELGGMEHNTWDGVALYPYTETHRRLLYLNTRINERMRRWNFGAGLSYQIFNMEKTAYDGTNGLFILPYRSGQDTSYQIAKQYNEGLGLNLSVQYQLSKNLYLGTMFQPLLFNTAPSAKGYMHYINVDLIFKLPVWKRK